MVKNLVPGALVKRMTALDNVMIGCLGSVPVLRSLLYGFNNREANQALDALEKVRIAHLAYRKVGSLSGGEMQRVAIARALFQNPVVLLVQIIAVGLGPFAGMLSLTIGTVGMFGKLFADAIEQVEGDAVEAIYATGANKLQAIRYVILPEVLPSFVANLFYAFDINLRAAIGLGVFRGGGIGYELQMAMQMLRYKDVLALIFFTIILISLFEKISDYLRKQIMQGEVLK